MSSARSLVEFRSTLASAMAMILLLLPAGSSVNRQIPHNRFREGICRYRRLQSADAMSRS